MGFFTHIKYVIESFYHITNLPIAAYNMDETLIYEYKDQNKKCMNCNNLNLLSNLKKELDKQEKPNIITMSCCSNLVFTAHPIYPQDLSLGFFIIGPFSVDRKRKDVEYKPHDLTPQIIYLLRSLIVDFSYLQEESTNNSTHYSIHVRKAIDYIHLHYKEEITLDQIVKFLDITKPYFCKIFKEETNKTFSLYLNEYRIKKAKELLNNTNISILDIALNTGFNNQNYFNIVFKKITNTTPIKYRNKVNKCHKK